MPVVVWWLLGGLTVGSAGGFVLGAETSRILKWAAVAAVVFWLIKNKVGR